MNNRHDSFQTKIFSVMSKRIRVFTATTHRPYLFLLGSLIPHDPLFEILYFNVTNVNIVIITQYNYQHMVLQHTTHLTLLSGLKQFYPITGLTIGFDNEFTQSTHLPQIDSIWT